MIVKKTAPLILCLILPAIANAETKKHSFKSPCTSEIYKEASGDNLWIYRFDTAKEKYHCRFWRRGSFGGGWNGGSVAQFEQHARYLAERGMATFVADYRVKSRQNTEPNACVADGKSAVRWLRKNAKRLNIDPARIAAGGGSAGGHVAATTGICDGLAAPGEKDSGISSMANALLLFYPVYDNGP